MRPLNRLSALSECGSGFPISKNVSEQLAVGPVQIWREENERRIPKDLPVFIMSGSDDPVADGGKNLHILMERYKSYGVKDVSVKIYEGARHEIFNETNREEVYNNFISSNKNSVLLTPSMSEGIDLKDDLARFIIIVKLPFGNLSDKHIKAKRDKKKAWYKYNTAINLIQVAGRGMRHADDYCSVYVLDSSFYSFVHRNKNFMTPYFLKSIMWHK